MGRTQRFVALIAFALLGCQPTRQCQLNSNCPTGRYCSAAGTCTADCTMDAECGSGRICNSFGMCVSGNPDPDDTGTFDAGRVPVDTGMLAVDTGSLDAGRVPVDTGMLALDTGTDAYVAAEVCTPSTAGAAPSDEDHDGAVDEGCAWNFGRVTMTPMLDVSAMEQLSPTLSDDGLRLYYTGYGGATGLYMASRASLATPFGPPVVVGLPAGFSADRTSVSSDELELFVEASGRSWRLTRGSRADAGGNPVPFMGPVELMVGFNPHVSRTGLELFYAAFTGGTPPVSIYRSTRLSTSAVFPPGTPITIVGSTQSTVLPTLAPDGRTLFFTMGMPHRLFRAQRSTLDAMSFTDAMEIVSEPQMEAVFVSRVSREVFFNRPGDWNAGVGRAQVCRDRACTDSEVTCNTIAGERRSPDGLHCYIPRVTPTRDWHAAALDCLSLSVGSQTAHLATIHSTGEDMLIRGMIGAHAWLGGYDGTPTADLGLVSVPQCTTAIPGCSFAWVTGEPWSFASWDALEPNNSAGLEDGLLMLRWGPWNDAHATDAWTSVCERDLWPTW